MFEKYVKNLVTSNGSLCDTLRSSMCHTTVIIYPFITFLPINGLYGFSLKPLFLKSIISVRYNISALYNSTYKEICNLTYNTLATFSITTYFWYRLGKIYTICSISHTLNIMITSSYDSMCRYDSGMPMISTYLQLCVNMAEVRIIASTDKFDNSEYFYDV